jgi:hypothetical protein
MPNVKASKNIFLKSTHRLMQITKDPQTTASWLEMNQRYLMAAIGEMRGQLSVWHAADSQNALKTDQHKVSALPTGLTLKELAVQMTAPPALETLCHQFGLSPFERALLLFCAGMELDLTWAAYCAVLHEDSRRTYPTFGLALSVFSDSHWSALTPDAPLRYWRLIEIGVGDLMTTSTIRIDERALNYLMGFQCLDDRLKGFITPLNGPMVLSPSHQAIAEQVRGLWAEPKKGPTSVIQLCGDDPASQRAVAAMACSGLGLTLRCMRWSDIPSSVTERDGLVRLLEREAILSGNALLLNMEGADTPEGMRLALALVESMQTFLMIIGCDTLRLSTRPFIRVDLPRISTKEQRLIWKKALGPLAEAFNGEVDTLLSHFNMNMQGIQTAVASVSRSALPMEESEGSLLWEICRNQARVRMEGLAQRIESPVTWKDLVLPASQMEMLHDIVTQVRQRVHVYETWGFAKKGVRGLGISALFAGPSGTGKTLAAEVLANALRLDLYRIDLSQVVSKYIGETEKHLKRLFDAAEESGAILLFDEADALLGKRSEVRDSHDRYANMEVSYLLQRMEAYRGLAILTTNMKSALDTAFLRRIRFVVSFPFPDLSQRMEVWKQVFPAETPTHRLNIEQLSRLNIAGGNIRNIAMHSAFLAADSKEPIGMHHLLRAAQSEYAKLERPLTVAEVGGWGEKS